MNRDYGTGMYFNKMAHIVFIITELQLLCAGRLVNLIRYFVRVKHLHSMTRIF